MSTTAYSLWRFSKKYEKRLNRNPSRIFEDAQFHITQLKGTIKETNFLLEKLGEEVKDWCDTLEYVYSVDEFNNIFERIQLFFLKKYVYYRYDYILREMRSIQISKQRLEKILKQLEVRNAF